MMPYYANGKRNEDDQKIFDLGAEKPKRVTYLSKKGKRSY